MTVRNLCGGSFFVETVTYESFALPCAKLSFRKCPVDRTHAEPYSAVTVAGKDRLWQNGRHPGAE